MYTKFARKLGRFASSLSVAVLLSSACSAVAAKDCWLDLYDKANYEGSHIRLKGPAELSSLKSLYGEDWSNRIESVIVGPDAEVFAFRQENFKDDPQGPINHPNELKVWGEKDIGSYQDLKISFGPGSKEHHLGDLNFHRNINSLTVQCRR
ncbi:beta/gamma crystallin domain-containing protein [Methylocaldum sp.]|uniref:beta/gamma crystallin domain-containing protein n=1 Tax=Methylocaldum sp. TaxID=1969727 RepID=UPI002D253F0E|nr:beta/gamma crystallin domain-containing protein [Methylocaldum sp.]HYE36227.1 beta/gamma crystallin domain-containing protein [Methylocaldum sp.]